MTITRTQQRTLATAIFALLLTGCSSSNPDLAEQEPDSTKKAASAKPHRFDGIWEVIGKTANENSVSEAVCGNEAGKGIITVKDSKITANITNKSGFDYTARGWMDEDGTLHATMIYMGYDAAEATGNFSTETNTGKGTFQDVVNLCPGVWETKRIGMAEATPQTESIKQPVNTQNPVGNSG
ncbi:MAG: hypothetical protein VX679_07755 [Pseudomonadota bacterium]|nr:hypothetical protein [Pseudomonadota bacterium]